MDNDSIEEYFTPLRVGGEGDGVQRDSAKKRAPKRLRAKTDTLKLKLETVFGDPRENAARPKVHNCLKSQSVAEITPTKSKTKTSRRVVPSVKLSTIGGDGVCDSVKDVNGELTTLHATPRRHVVASKRCSRRWAECKVQRRLLVLAWRRTRCAKLDMERKMAGMEEQMGQLELQVDVLKNLRNSESDRRKEAVNEALQLKKRVGQLEEENATLNEDLKNIKDCFGNTQKNLNLTKCDLKRCSEQLAKLQELLKRKKAEKMELRAKISGQEQEICMQNTIISRLEKAISTTALNLQNTEKTLKAKEDQYHELFVELEREKELNTSLKEDVASLQQQKLELESVSRIVEEKLEDLEISYDRLQEEHETLKEDFLEASMQLCDERKKTWASQTKDVAMLSLSTLHKVFDAVIPVYLENPL